MNYEMSITIEKDEIEKCLQEVILKQFQNYTIESFDWKCIQQFDSFNRPSKMNIQSCKVTLK